MTDDIDTDKPASEQFDLGDVNLDADRINDLAAELERAEDVAFGEWPTDRLAETVAALKRLESAAEDARKDHAESELDGRVSEGERVRNLQKRMGSSTYVTDTEGAFAAVADAGADPLEVASVNVGDLRDILGADADDYLGQSEYSYFARQS